MRVSRDEENIVQWNNSEGNGRKKVWCVTNSVLEEELRLWAIRMWNLGVFLNENLIQEKARKIQCALNESLQPQEQSNMQFSNGWLYLLKQRQNFKCYKSHGDQGDADDAGACAALPRLRQLAAQYSLADIFNADEFGLCYSAAPKSTIGPGRLPGRKVNKDRATFLVCTNVDGSESLPPLLVGRARRPRCFGRGEEEVLNFEYDYGEKGWMNTMIFTRCLYRFDARIGSTPGRKVLLFIDNASAHGTIDNLPTLNHIHIEFLPKRTTSILQPLDLGVIACLKSRYKRKVAQRAVDLIEDGHSEMLYRIDLKLAGIWVQDLWSRIQNEIIYKCWRKSSLV